MRGDCGAAQHARASALADPIGRRPRLAVGGGHLDVGAKADDEIELQFLGQHPIELVVAEATISHDANLDIRGQCLGQAHQDLILVAVATVLQRGRLDRQPDQRRRPAMAGEQRQHDRRLAVGVELGPVHGHRDAGPLADDIGYPVDQQSIDIDPLVGQHAVDLLDGILGQQSTGQRQTLADQGHRERGGRDRPERSPRQRENTLGMQVFGEQGLQEAMDALERDLLVGWHRTAPWIDLRGARIVFLRLLQCLSVAQHKSNVERAPPESFRKRRTTFQILFLHLSQNRNEGNLEAPPI